MSPNQMIQRNFTPLSFTLSLVDVSLRQRMQNRFTLTPRKENQFTFNVLQSPTVSVNFLQDDFISHSFPYFSSSIRRGVLLIRQRFFLIRQRFLLYKIEEDHTNVRSVCRGSPSMNLRTGCLPSTVAVGLLQLSWSLYSINQRKWKGSVLRQVKW